MDFLMDSMNMNTANHTSRPYWTHPSVLALGMDIDPVQEVIKRARTSALDAVESGWSGPPFDPFDLAALCGIETLPRNDIQDARLIPLGSTKYRIEFNPHQPRARIRFSVAHELAHTLFPDCREQIRNRLGRRDMRSDEWQLEMLCNVAGAELLMPVGALPEFTEDSLTIDVLVQLRKRFEVSMEAVLLRAIRLARTPCAAFAASRQEDNGSEGYQLDYVVNNNGWDSGLRTGQLLSEDSILSECNAIGFTSKGTVDWNGKRSQFRIECVGVPAHPSRAYPRIVGLIVPAKLSRCIQPSIKYVRGDATEPRGRGNRIIAHVVNDGAARWGAGFARVLGRKWTFVQKDFVQWTAAHRQQFRLGESRLCEIDESLAVFHMICQRGYGPSEKPRLKYRALELCLADLARIANERSASVHMPRIGCGQAGGKWEIVAELIDELLCRKHVEVTVYDLPNEDWPPSRGQMKLFNT
jgi:O-acetyl-ADP-ribose deacetylase (regulator of RNase III)